MPPSERTLIRFADVAPVAWANGGGSTRVLIDDAAAQPDGEWTFRISVAELSGRQPFSRFDDIDRHLTFLGPGKLDIRINDAWTVLGPFDHVEFEGEDAVDSEPSVSPARDLNVMTRRGRANARVTPTNADGTILASATAHRTLWIARDPSTAGGHDLAPLDVLQLHPGRPTPVHGRGVLVEIL